MESFDLEHDLFVSIIAFNFPAPEIEVDDLLAWKLHPVEEIGKKDGFSSIPAYQPDDPELENLELFSLSGGYFLQIVATWSDEDHVFGFTAFHEFLYGWESALSWTPEDEIAMECIQQMGDKFIARVTSIKKDDVSRRDMGNQLFGLFSFGAIDIDHTPGYRYTSKDIIDSGNQALGIVPFPAVLESTMRIEFPSDLFPRRQGVFRSIYGKNRHAMPRELRALWPTLVGKRNGIVKDTLKDLPVHFVSCFTEGAMVDCFGIRPKTTAFSISEELTRLHFYSFAFTTGSNGENEGDELWESELAFSSEILRRLFP
jgi:hypothetical protein